MNLDILGLNETWLSSDVNDHELSLPGYNILRRDRNRRGGGICIYVKDTINFSVIEGIKNDNVESIWIRCIVDKECFDLCVVYRPPSASCEYFENILDQVEFVKQSDNDMIIIGDLNFNYSFDENLHQNPVYQLESMFEMKQLVVSPTRVTTTSSTLIDVILSSCPDKHVKTSVIDCSLSDHCLVLTEFTSRSSKTHVHKTVTFRNFKKFDLSQFLNDLSDCTNVTNTILNNGDVDSHWKAFKNDFINICDDHAPMTARRLKERHNPWIDNDIIDLMYKRDYLKRQAVKLKDNELYSQYRRLRNEVTNKIRQAQKHYYEREITENRGNPSKLWKVISKIANGNKRCDPPSGISADEFNEHFSSVGENIAKQTISNNRTTPWKGPKSCVVFELHKVSCCEVKKQLNKLKNKCNSDVLGMDAKLLHLSADVIAPKLTSLYNASIETSTVPCDWKFARVSPVYKNKGCKLDKNNYRPISVISHVSKIFERLIQVQLMEYLIKNEYISIHQSAYRKYHNTQTCLHRVVDDWLDNIGDNIFTGVCLLDIKKCFDSISHSILLDKLSYYGICGKENDFFRSYLSNRKQVVKCGTITSDIENINVGVPQGSLLGPVLFMLFVNDNSQHVHLGTCNLYADDCLVYCTGDNVDDVSDKLQQCVHDVSNWYSENNLLLNVDKCNTMLIGSKYKLSQLNDNDK